MTTTIAEINRRLNPVITEREIYNSPYIKEEVYKAIYNMVKKEAKQYVDISNHISIEL